MKMKKALAFLLGLTLSVPMGVPAFAEEITDSETEIPAEEETETVPEAEPEEETAVPHLYAAPPEMILSYSGEIQESLPESIDFRKQGLVTAVKDQGSLGTCWAHAAIANIESAKIKEYPHIDLSERYLAQFVTSEAYGRNNPEMDEGAHIGEAVGALVNWIGPVSESVAPYLEEYDIFSKSRKEFQQEAEFHVIGTNYILFKEDEDPTPLIQKAKQFISEGHPLQVSMYFNADNFLNRETNAYYYSPESEVELDTNTAHAMLIVGYDDNYDKENFKYPPEHNGAFLIKNSWGTAGENSGDNGYVWISYDESTIWSMTYFDVEDAQMHDTLYAYDDFGCNGYFALSEDGDETVYVSNVFTAEKDGFITDAMFCCNGATNQYEVTVYTNLKEESVPTSGEAHGMTSGEISHLGYHTIPLNEAVHVNEGETFAVVAKLSGEKSYQISCEYSSNLHGRPAGFSGFTNSSEDAIEVITEDKIMATFGKNQSFFSADGENWTDMYDSYDYDNENLTGNLCLKALGVNEGTIHFSSYSETLPLNSEISLSCADGKNIYYSVNGGEYALYTEPIAFTEEMDVSAYAEGEEEAVYTKHYNVEKAELSSLLILNHLEEHYADVSQENEFEIIIPVGNDEAKILPMMTGTLTDGENVYHSNEEIALSCEFDPVTYHFTSEEENLLPVEYTFHLRKEYETNFSSGIWGAFSEEDMLLKNGYYSFNEDGVSGFHVDRFHGTKTEFTYSIEDGIITMNMGKTVRTGHIISNYSFAKIRWDDTGKFETMEILDNNLNETPFLTNPELSQLAETYYTAMTGEKPETSSVELAEDITAVITVSSQKGGELIFTVNTVNAIGTLQNGNIVNLNTLPEKSECSKFKAGIWQAITEYGTLKFYYFNEDGTIANIIYASNGDSACVNCELKENQLHFTSDEFGIDDKALVSIQENSAVITWGYGEIENLTWFSDATPETFSFLTDKMLSEFAQEYYFAQTCVITEFETVFTKEDGSVLVATYPFYDDISEIEFGEAPYYHVDRFTGIGTDQNGNAIDLRNPVETPSEGIKAGTWFIYQSVSNGGVTNELYTGAYWFSPDKTTGIFKEAFSGMETKFTYRIIDNIGVAVTEEGLTYQIYVYEYDGETHIDWILDTEDEFLDNLKREKIVYIETESPENFTYYSESKICRMAQKDFEKYAGLHTEASSFLKDDGTVIVTLIVPNEPEEYIYEINQLTGKGTRPDGKEANLPKTGNPSPVSAVTAGGASFALLAGLWTVIKSRIFKKKKI